MRIYLAGPINGCDDATAKTWRDHFKSIGIFDYVDPMRRDYRGHEEVAYRQIVDLDKLDIRSSDAVVVMFVQPSVGTSMEVFYAWTIGKPVVVIDQSEKPLSPWMVYHSTAVVHSVEAAVQMLRKWFGRGGEWVEVAQ